MKFVEGKAISRLNGEQRAAQLATCDKCDGTTFKVFDIDGHSHLECATCGTSYCDGSCGFTASDDEGTA